MYIWRDVRIPVISLIQIEHSLGHNGDCDIHLKNGTVIIMIIKGIMTSETDFIHSDLWMTFTEAWNGEGLMNATYTFLVYINCGVLFYELPFVLYAFVGILHDV